MKMRRCIRKPLFLLMIFLALGQVGYAQEQIPIETADELATPQYLLDTVLAIKYDPENPTSFTADQLLPRIHEEFLGALFVCNPFCEVIGLKLGQEWKPDLAKVYVHSKNMRLMDVDDPLFPILFPSKKNEAKESSRRRRNARRERETLVKKANQLLKPEEKPAKTPKTAFDNAFRYGLNGRYTLVTQKSDGNVQREFSPKSGLMNFDLNLGYYRGKPLRLLNRWLQFEVGYDMTLIGTKSSLENDLKMETSRTRMYFITWVRSVPFNWGLKLSQTKNSYEVSENRITSFSFKEESQFIGAAFKYKRYRFDIDYGLGYKIAETQPFRDKLLESTQISIEGMSCMTKQKISGTTFFPCYGASYIMTDNEATFNPAISPTGSVALKRQDIGVFMNIYFGEDFLR